MAQTKHLQRLNNSVAVWHPPTNDGSGSKTDASNPKSHPDLILLCAWMGASDRHIAKYTSGYRKLYPSTRIVSIKTTMVDVMFSSHAANIKRVDPVLEVLYALPSDAKLILHLFSNGGSLTSAVIAKQYQHRKGKLLPATAMVLDSTPGRATYEASIRAFAVGLPSNFVIRTVGVLMLRVLFRIVQFMYFLTSQPDVIEQVRRDLNRKTLMDLDTPRLYIYSDADQMVDWRFVEEHIEEARELGYTVEGEKYLQSGHCGHMMKDEKKYWGAVEKLWSTV